MLAGLPREGPRAPVILRLEEVRYFLPPIINAQQLTKSFGAKPLFEKVSFTISDGDRIGLIGPNGSGKSTLLRILAGEVSADEGEVAARKRTRLVYVEQDSRFAADATVRSIVERALDRSSQTGADRGAIFA
jgi:ABC transport system ATP-binding/permease protein